MGYAIRIKGSFFKGERRVAHVSQVGVTSNTITGATGTYTNSEDNVAKINTLALTPATGNIATEDYNYVLNGTYSGLTIDLRTGTITADAAWTASGTVSVKLVPVSGGNGYVLTSFTMPAYVAPAEPEPEVHVYAVTIKSWEGYNDVGYSATTTTMKSAPVVEVTDNGTVINVTPTLTYTKGANVSSVSAAGIPTIAANTVSTAKTCTVSVTASYNGVTSAAVSKSFSQTGIPVLQVSPNSLTFNNTTKQTATVSITNPVQGQSVTITNSNTTDFTATISGTTISVTPKNAVGSTERTATITIKYTGATSITLSATQANVTYSNLQVVNALSYSSANVAASNASATVTAPTYTYNKTISGTTTAMTTGATITYSSDSAWCTVNSSTGALTISDNTATTSRQATITATISVQGMTATSTFTITQTAADAVYFEYEPRALGGDNVYEITTQTPATGVTYSRDEVNNNDGWNIDECDWKGTDNDVVANSFNENTGTMSLYAKLGDCSLGGYASFCTAFTITATNSANNDTFSKVVWFPCYTVDLTGATIYENVSLSSARTNTKATSISTMGSHAQAITALAGDLVYVLVNCPALAKSKADGCAIVPFTTSASVTDTKFANKLASSTADDLNPSGSGSVKETLDFIFNENGVAAAWTKLPTTLTINSFMFEEIINQTLMTNNANITIYVKSGVTI